MPKGLDRRQFLGRATALGCSLAASPFVTPISYASAPWDTRLVVIILRGGMDAIDVVQPYGDPAYAGLRRTLPGGPGQGSADLDGFFALHPRLGPLLPLWRKGELGFVHAVSTPYRDKRSHFDGQDLLEAGTSSLVGVRDGWLNRALQHLPGVEQRTAFAIGYDDMRLLSGAAPVANWSPDTRLAISPQALRLTELLMEEDPLFHNALSEAVALSQDDDAGQMLSETQLTGQQMSLPKRVRGKAHIKVADFAAERLRRETRVVSFSLNGWDTHNRQANALGRALDRLSETILTLQSGVGPEIWQRTAVLAMTEFGRTVRENGTQGTDHGTGGALLLAGGALRGGRVYGQWPGLSEADLFDRRDLMPTGDLRAATAWILRGLTGLERSALETAVFPGLDMGGDPGLLL